MTDCIPVLKESGLQKLKSRVESDDFKKHYGRASEAGLPEDWCFSRTTIAPALALPSFDLSGDKTDDVGNAQRIYESLRNLTPVDASRAELWAYLAHTDYFEYTKARWLNGNAPKSRGVVLTRFLGLGQAKLGRHAVSRLWWSAHLTRAPWEQDPALECFKHDDPYHFTGLILGTQDVYQGLLERRFGRDLRLRITVMQLLKERAEAGVTPAAADAKRVFKIVNQMLSYLDLGLLEPMDMKARLEKALA
ncbi:DUF6339 family protein [bacterium]|nr:DUF6339 family protein [bacterium]MDA7668732.1 DUF6339 family protein [bacterium]MDB4628012.1 DUF6339 family protein [bacterium]MDB4632845.1 DUF6339 family protein [bacterium]